MPICCFALFVSDNGRFTSHCWNLLESTYFFIGDTMTTKDTAQQRSFYRRDIDGLRAIAVLAVIVNHFSAVVLPCGNVGVDIFFAISGFVITASLSKRSEITLGDFILNFYSRRIRRLWPGLLLCVMVTSIVICFFDESHTLSLRTGIAALFGISNLYILKQATDYFGPSSALNPFTHTWSLGVEEQFYLLFPLIYWFGIYRAVSWRRSLMPYLMFCTVIASLGAFLYFYHVNQPMAFFLMPTRWWELMAGSMTFFAVRRYSRSKAWLPVPLVLAALLGILFLPEKYEEIATVCSVVLACLLLYFVQESTGVYRVLTCKPLTYIGLLSYSLYLWHWSVLTVCRWTVGISLPLLPIQLVLILGLAAAAYHFVEQPLRRRLWFSSQRATVSIGLLGSVASAAILLFLLFPASGILYTGKVISHHDSANILSSVQTKGSIVLIGDSHAGQFNNLGKSLANKYGRSFTSVSNGATLYPTAEYSTPVGGLTRSKTRRTALEANEQVDRILNDSPSQQGRLIILSSFYSFYFSAPVGSRRYQTMSHYDPAGRSISSDQALHLWLSKLDAFANQHPLDRIVIALSTPEMPNIYPSPLCQQEWFRPHVSRNCFVQIDRSAEIARLAKINTLITDHARLHSNTLAFDPFDAICPPSGSTCSSSIAGMRIYGDEDHLNDVGSELVARSLEKYLIQHGVLRPN